jgi:TRAP-type transport system small permease protein
MASNPSHGAPEAGRGGRMWLGAYNALGHVGGLILAVMSGAVVLQVVMRFLGWTGIDGLDEVPRYLFVWLVMIGAASAMQRGQHTVLDYFVNLLSPRGRALVLILTNAVGIALFAYLIKLSLVLVPNAQLQTSPGLGLSLGFVYAAIPIGSALIILPMLRNIVVAARSLWLKRS